MKLTTLNTIEEMLNSRDIKIKELEEENKKLKSDLAFERTMLDNVKAEYKSLQDIIKKLNEENETLKEELISRIRQPKNVPYWKWVVELMEEDTLQELRDIGKI